MPPKRIVGLTENQFRFHNQAAKRVMGEPREANTGSVGNVAVGNLPIIACLLEPLVSFKPARATQLRYTSNPVIDIICDGPLAKNSQAKMKIEGKEISWPSNATAEEVQNVLSKYLTNCEVTLGSRDGLEPGRWMVELIDADTMDRSPLESVFPESVNDGTVLAYSAIGSLVDTGQDDVPIFVLPMGHLLSQHVSDQTTIFDRGMIVIAQPIDGVGYVVSESETWHPELEGRTVDDLDYANSYDQPSFCMMELWDRVKGATGIKIRITNRDETLKVDKKTRSRARRIGREYHLTWVACEPEEEEEET